MLNELNTINKFKDSNLRPIGYALILLLVWAFIQYLLYNKLGLRIPRDAEVRYIPHAQKIAFEGYFDLGYDIRYVGYTILIAIVLKLKLSLMYLVYAQIFLSLVALILLYKITYHLTISHFYAFVATLLLASSQDIQQWNYYILTDSVFTVALIACFYLLVTNQNRGRLLLIPLLLYTCLVRPNGFIIVAAVFVYFYSVAYFRATQWQRRNLELAILIFGSLLLLLSNQILSPFTIVETYARGEIIYGSPDYKITPPADLKMPPAEAFALQKIVLFFWENPLFAFKQFFGKGITFLAFVKPYFSLFHKIVIIITVYPCYIFITQAFKDTSLRSYTLAIATIITLETLIVMFTSEDWDCRFIVPILPFIYLLGTIGLRNVLKPKVNLV